MANIIQTIKNFPGVEDAHYQFANFHLAVHLKPGADIISVKSMIQDLIDLRCLNRSFETISYYTDEQDIAQANLLKIARKNAGFNEARA